MAEDVLLYALARGSRSSTRRAHPPRLGRFHRRPDGGVQNSSRRRTRRSRRTGRRGASSRACDILSGHERRAAGGPRRIPPPDVPDAPAGDVPSRGEKTRSLRISTSEKARLLLRRLLLRGGLRVRALQRFLGGSRQVDQPARRLFASESHRTVLEPALGVAAGRRSARPASATRPPAVPRDRCVLDNERVGAARDQGASDPETAAADDASPAMPVDDGHGQVPAAREERGDGADVLLRRGPARSSAVRTRRRREATRRCGGAGVSADRVADASDSTFSTARRRSIRGRVFRLRASAGGARAR